MRSTRSQGLGDDRTEQPAPRPGCEGAVAVLALSVQSLFSSNPSLCWAHLSLTTGPHWWCFHSTFSGVGGGGMFVLLPGVGADAHFHAAGSLLGTPDSLNLLRFS